MNRIAHLFDEDEFLIAIRTGGVKIEPPPKRLVRLGDIGGEQLPDFDYSHNVAGVGSQRGCETPEEERTVLPVDRCGLAVWLASLVMCALLAFAAWVVEWLADLARC